MSNLSKDKLKVITFCSGTDSPVAALHELLGPDKVDHAISCDHDADSFRFIMANFSPRHYFQKVESFLQESAHCDVCAGECTACAQEEADLLVGGFPCTPFSMLNMHRWSPGHSPFESADAQPFLQISRFLHTTRVPPKIVVFENVKGLIMKGKVGEAPVEFIMNGVRRNAGGRLVKYGLKHLQNYVVLDPVTTRSADVGLPMVRSRIFIVLIRKDIVTKCCVDVAQIHRFMDIASANPLPIANLADFLTDSESDCDAGQPEKRRRTSSFSDSLPDSAAIGSYTFRKENRLLPRQVPGGQPFSVSADARLVEMSARERDVVDCAWLWHRSNDGSIPETLAIDVSQSVSRMPWRNDGFVHSLHVNAKLVVQGRHLTRKTLFKMMGWPRAVPCDLSGFSESSIRKLTGNMIATPVIGVLFLAILLEVRL